MKSSDSKRRSHAGKAVTRRDFLRGSAIAAAGFTIVPSWVFGGNGRVAPSDRINHGIIGTGAMGRSHILYCRQDPNAELLALCDVDQRHLQSSARRAGGDVARHTDFRELLAREDVDVVHIVTPPHWHAPIAVAAARAGKDIWCEKPMTRTIAEGQYVIDAVKRYGRVFRLNTWFRFEDTFYGLGTPVRPLKKLIDAGLLGWPLTVRVSPYTGFGWKLGRWTGRTDLKPRPVPDALDYDFWLGPAPKKPYNPDRVHGKFRGYWDYDGGGLADMGQHYLDPVQYMLGKDGTSPVEIEADAPFPQHPDAVGLWYRVEMTYADGCRIILESGESGRASTQGKPYIEGPRGKVYQGFRTDPPELAEKVKHLPDPPRQRTDFHECIRRRRPFALNETNGDRSNILVHLPNCAIRTGRKLKFDPHRKRFVDDEEANKLAEQPMRSPWSLS